MKEKHVAAQYDDKLELVWRMTFTIFAFTSQAAGQI